MNFDQLKHRVERTETLVDGRICQVTDAHSQLQRQWREAWTPLRIVVAGLVTGFIAGRTEPQAALQKIGKVSGSRWVQTIGSISGLLSSVQATIAAVTAKDAAETVDDAAGDARQAAQPASAPAQQAAAAASAAAAGAGTGARTAPDPPSTDAGDVPDPAGPAPETRRRADPQWESQPSPAEAATDVSER